MTQRCDVCAAWKEIVKNNNLKREYCEQINNLLKKRRASAESIYIRTLVVPASFRRHASAEKKVRLVFDAARPYERQMSERSLLTGPDLIRSLLGVLVRFRQGRVVSADIKEMFLRVKIRKKIETAYDSCGEITCTKIHKVPNDITDFRRRLIILVLRSTSKIATPQNLNLSTRRRAKRYD
ncbi:hypothetical protein EVAR_41019_1 [Eumeta japonica]|uniref:Uncharacterized protein n=1 Tax=Eumeta variegata TaxID=151549 RepID=A0A4C1Z1H1_EUMVA|nr:hypothetical protein EVAR_41019_1 [Eumeta japonica]